MKNKMIQLGFLGLMIVVAFMGSGCAMFRASTSNVDVTKEQHMGSTYDFSDLRSFTQNVVDELLASPFLANASAPPVMMTAGVQNRTQQYVDTKGLTDRMRTLMLQSGKVRFVNEARRDELLKEQGFQAAHATPETQVSVGKQLGAKYMMSGSLMEMENTSPRQVRISKQQVNYYKLTIEVSDLETSEIMWTTEKEIARQASQPLIGW